MARSGQNPASPEQYRLAQAVLSGTARTTRMPARVAREIVEKTPANLRREWSRPNPKPQGKGPYSITIGPRSKSFRSFGDAHRYGIQQAKTLTHAHFQITDEVTGDSVQYSRLGTSANPATGKRFEDRVRFDWGYWDGVQAAREKWPYRYSHFDTVWLAGFQEGFNDQRNGEVGTTSDAAWKRFRESKRKNPETQAARMFEKFHGAPSEGVIEFEEAENYHGHLAECGLLVGLMVRTIHGKDIELAFGLSDAAAVRNPLLSSRWIRYSSHSSALAAERAAAKLAAKGVEVKVRRKDVTKGWSLKKKYSHEVFADREQLRQTLRGKSAKALKETKYKGLRIVETADGYSVPQLDTSKFEDLQQAKRFIDANPGPVAEATKLLGSASGYLTERGPLGAAYKAGSRAVKYVDDQLGRALRGNPGGPVILATNEKGTQLYLIGGDQALDLKALNIPAKDSVVVGQVWLICYRTEKSFDDFKDVDYVHGFGGDKAHPRLSKSADLWIDAKPPERLFDTGKLPTLRYDCLNERMHLDGGVYKINKPILGVSPGIED